MEGRDIVRAVTRDEYVRDPKSVHEGPGIEPPPPKMLTMYPEVKYEGYKWGMAIDLNACIGCNACVVACQAENNIPVVGKEQVLRGREMHWLRVDRYYRRRGRESRDLLPAGALHAVRERAVRGRLPGRRDRRTAHEGLNDMVYNRCVGTRYCSNNCPYKVRRFNFLLYSATATRRASSCGRNPDVTVRSRGVMEKCTYCVQRINARQDRRREGRPARCATARSRPPASRPARPTRSSSATSTIRTAASRSCRREVRNYALLAELNTRPRTTYLAAVRNANPELGEMSRHRSSRSRIPTRRWSATGRPPVIAPGHTFGTVTDKISAIVLTRTTPTGWWLGFGIGVRWSRCCCWSSLTYLVVKGIGIWGNNIPVGWAFDIINFVWWIGIGHAGTLISAILLLLQQKWRTSINRFAEAMTLFAVVVRRACSRCSTLGRPWFVYWLFPYPNTMGIWPQFRSPLIWDVFAVSTYCTVSLLFWFVGLIPDLATLRDRVASAGRPDRLRHAGAGLARLGARTGTATRRPTCCWPAWRRRWSSRCTPSVSFDFAVGIVPGWHTTIFPPYFVAGAIYSGFAMVLTLAIPMRAVYGLEDFITMRHLENMAKVMLVDRADRRLRLHHRGVHRVVQRRQVRRLRADEPHVRAVRGLLLGADPLQRRDPAAAVVQEGPHAACRCLFIISLIVNVGMWLERFVIIVTQPAPRLPALVVGHVLRRRSGTGRPSSARSACSCRCCSCSCASCR